MTKTLSKTGVGDGEKEKECAAPLGFGHEKPIEDIRERDIKALGSRRKARGPTGGGSSRKRMRHWEGAQPDPQP